MSVSSAVSAKSAMSFRSTRSDISRASTAGRSQFHWQKFRSNVLLPHHIRLLPSTSGENIPESILAYLDINRLSTAKFSDQRKSFRKHVTIGRGFGASAFFPSDVLPALSGQSLLTRCMVPSYSADALPERMATKASSKSDLSSPRPSLGYGFSEGAFSSGELKKFPRYLLSTGTRFQVDIDSQASDSPLCCPFLSFERVFSTNEYGVDLASNQCAVDGAWSVRALQMLYAAAVGEDVKEQFQKPISFSCCIDNDIALVNYHWIDHAQTYCMAPVVKFDLTSDDDFDQLLLWVEAISQWATVHLLPEVRRALSLLSLSVSPELAQTVTSPNPRPFFRHREPSLPSLKTDYDYTQMQLKQGLWSPSISSTASWGSPVVDEVTLEKLMLPKVAQTRSVGSDSNIARVRFPCSPTKPLKSSLKVRADHPISVDATVEQQPLAAYEKNPELVIKKRLGHAMDEIEELQAQMMQLKTDITGSVSCLQAELAGMRKAMTSMVRKEKPSTPKPRTQLRINPLTSVQHAEELLEGQKSIKPLITTPTEFRPVPFHQRKNSRNPSGLSNVLTPLDTSVSAVVTVRSPRSAGSNRSPTSPQSNVSSPTSPKQLLSPDMPNNVPSPSIAPPSSIALSPSIAPSPSIAHSPSIAPSPSIASSDAISCISCLSCREAAAKSRMPPQQETSELIQSITSYRKRTNITTICFQAFLLLCFVDYLVLLSEKVRSPVMLEYFHHWIHGLN